MTLGFWREHPYLGAFSFSSLVLVGYQLLLYMHGGVAEWRGWHAQVPVFIYLLAWLSIGAIALAKQLLRIEWAPLAVARTVVDEALRMKIAVVFVAVLLVCLAGLPFLVQSGTSVLRYRVQTLIRYEFTATGALLSLMTVFLACGTLSLEIQDLRIFTTLCKPIGRWQYLFGKWLGLLALNTALLLVAAAAIYMSIRWVAGQEALADYDREVLNQEVMTARASIPPKPPEDEFEAELRKRIEKVKVQDPERYGKTPEDQRAAKAQMRKQLERQWLVVPPQRSRTYVFGGLEEAKRRGVPVQVRYKMLYIGSFQEINVRQKQRIVRRFQVNGIDMGPQRFILGRFTNLWVAPDLIEDGQLRMTIYNSDPVERDRASNITLKFVPGVGLEAFYPADSFGPNFARGMAMLWVKLAFLAVLGLMTATFLGFPVACLVSLVILISAWLSGFLLGDIDRYGIGFESAGAKGFAFVVQTVVRSVAGLLKRYSEFVPGPLVAEGRLVSWAELGRCVWWIGVIWCGLTGLIGAVIFRIREVGRVQV